MTRHASIAHYAAAFSGPAVLQGAHGDAQRDGELLTYFQPLVTVDGELAGCEALARWRRPDGTFVPPAEFVAVAERTGSIHALGELMLRESLHQLSRFDAARLDGLFMSVNVSPTQLEHRDFGVMLADALTDTGVAPARLSLEVTEGIAVTDLSGVSATLRRIADTGVRISLDDYGTGYSGMTYLKMFPVSTVKLDQSFVRDVGSDRTTRVLVNGFIRVAQELGLRTIAEGVETVEQARIVKELGFDYIQGYLYGKPMPADELIARFAPPSTLVH
jgi:EAL domain-containing protein (putative c-di-GMP-specific phosphodiesterase class I)